MNRFTSLASMALIASTLLGATAAFADPMPLTSYLTATDPYQNGRLSRNGIPQDFSGTEPYPGYNAATIGSLYHYQVFSIAVGAAPYIEISFDNTAAQATTNSFIAAYQSAYYVTNYATTWLGDVGSAAYFAGDPGYMDIVATPFSTLVLVVNAGSAGNTGIGAANPFTIDAQSFTDTEYDGAVDLAISRGGQVVPEPSTFLLLAPLALVAGLKSRRRRPATAALLAA